jgi:hypothetical protein
MIIRLKSIFLFLFVFSFLVSCNDDTEQPLDSASPSNNLSLSKDAVEWFLAEAPDTVRVNIAGGTLPYSIDQAPKFSCSAVINDKYLNLIPIKTAPFGLDSVVIIDSVGEKKLLEITVKSYSNVYLNLIKANLSVFGDTSFTQTMSKLLRVDWETRLKEVNVHISNDTSSLQMVIKNVNGVGQFPLLNIGYNTSSKPFNERITFTVKDSTQQISFLKLSKDTMSIDFTINAKDQWDNYQGNANVSGSFVFVK